jgi:hypothetical protein
MATFMALIPIALVLRHVPKNISIVAELINCWCWYPPKGDGMKTSGSIERQEERKKALRERPAFHLIRTVPCQFLVEKDTVAASPARRSYVLISSSLGNPAIRVVGRRMMSQLR